jgi:glutamate N-acetyltransferase/amino-acid N-acetyltransferase
VTLEPLPSGLPTVDERACMPAGFRAGATASGIKASGHLDLGVLATTGEPASVAATFTRNQIVAAPVRLSQTHLAGHYPVGAGRFGYVDAVISTSGCANAATGPDGERDQADLAAALAADRGTEPELTLAISTGLIGTRLPVSRIRGHLSALVRDGLSATDEGLAALAEQMRTTDTHAKAATVRLELPDRRGRRVPVTVAGIAKGVGMIHPRMATMLALVLTDARVEPLDLHALLQPSVARTWNQVTVDGDTSTNDTVFILASGAAGVEVGLSDSAVVGELGRAIEAVARSLARQQAADGEGARSLITCQVSGAEDDADARAVARSVVSSSLVKAAVHGHDPNWGRIAAAAGNAHLADAAMLVAGGMAPAEALERAGQAVTIDERHLQIAICGVPVFAGSPMPFDAQALGALMASDEVLVRLDLGAGSGAGDAFGCDLSEQYVVENSAYST